MCLNFFVAMWIFCNPIKDANCKNNYSMASNYVHMLVAIMHWIFCALAWILFYVWNDSIPVWALWGNLIFMGFCLVTYVSFHNLDIVGPSDLDWSWTDSNFVTNKCKSCLKVCFLTFICTSTIYTIYYTQGSSAFSFLFFWLIYGLFFLSVKPSTSCLNTQRIFMCVVVGLLQTLCWRAWRKTHRQSFALLNLRLESDYCLYYDMNINNFSGNSVVINNVSSNSVVINNVSGNSVVINSHPQHYLLQINPSQQFKFGSKPIEFEQTNCIICLQDYKNEDSCVELNCKHVFHNDCFERWSRLGLGNGHKCCVCNNNNI